MIASRWALVAALLPALAFGQVFGGGTFSSSRARTATSNPVPLPKTLVGVGDSIMNGYGADSPLVYATPALGAGAYSVNAGNPGETSAQISDRWLASEATVCGVQRCSHVWLEGGINDLRLTNRLPPAILASMLVAVDDALAKGYVVVWSDMLPCRGDAGCSDAVIDNVLSYNALMAAACATAPRSLNPRLRCFFLYDTFVDPARFREDGVTLAGYLLPAYSRDELHLTNAGSQAMGIAAGFALQD